MAAVAPLEQVLDDTPEAPPRPPDLESNQAPESVAAP
jgi:hypothetical protein